MKAPLPQLAATLALLLTTHPALAALPVTVELRDGEIWFETDHGSPAGADVAAALAKALRAKHHQDTGARKDGGTYVSHAVYGKFAHVPVHFSAFVYPDAKTPADQAVA